MGIRKEHSTNCINKMKIVECDLAYSLNMLGGRWKILILGKLEGGQLRFGELREKVEGITDRMLTLQLKELEADGLVKRTVFAEIPPRVEYELTEFTKELIPVWRVLEDWGAKHRNRDKKDCA